MSRKFFQRSNSSFGLQEKDGQSRSLHNSRGTQLSSPKSAGARAKIPFVPEKFFIPNLARGGEERSALPTESGINN